MEHLPGFLRRRHGEKRERLCATDGQRAQQLLWHQSGDEVLQYTNPCPGNLEMGWDKLSQTGLVFFFNCIVYIEVFSLPSSFK